MTIRGLVRRVIRWAYDQEPDCNPLFGQPPLDDEEGYAVFGYGEDDGGAFSDLLFTSAEIDDTRDTLVAVAVKLNELQARVDADVAARTPVVPLAFCRARPTGLEAGPIEHVHQFPYTEADAERYRAFGWMVNAEACIVPGVPFATVDGDPEPKRLEVLDALNQTSG